MSVSVLPTIILVFLGNGFLGELGNLLPQCLTIYVILLLLDKYFIKYLLSINKYLTSYSTTEFRKNIIVVSSAAGIFVVNESRQLLTGRK